MAWGPFGGVRESDTFRTRQEAAQWALQREAELSGTRLPDKSLADALRRYAADIRRTGSLVELDLEPWIAGHEVPDVPVHR